MRSDGDGDAPFMEWTDGHYIARRCVLAVAFATAAVLSSAWAAGRTSGRPAVEFPACSSVDPGDAELVARGEALFVSDQAFGQTGPFPACASCHPSENHFTDNLNHEVAPTGDVSLTVLRNTPSLLQNLGRTFPYSWDGRGSCLQVQIFGAITSPLEMGGSLSTDTGQDQLDALTAYLLTLRPPPPILDGLDHQKVASGEAVFNGRGTCVVCHPRPDFTDNRFNDTRIDDNDLGAGLVGQGPFRSFNTPALLGVRLSAPYFHNGRNGVPDGSAVAVETEPRNALRQVVDFYDERFGLALTRTEMENLVEFLLSL